MQQTATKWAQPSLPGFKFSRGGFEVEFTALIYQWIDDVGLPPTLKLFSHKRDHITELRLIPNRGENFPSARWHFVNYGDVKSAIDGHRQRARDGCSCHYQNIRGRR